MVGGAAGDEVVVLDEDLTVVGAMDKLEAHRGPTRHLAFSVVLFDQRGRLLLQRRAQGKYHFAGRWSNTCCSHPRPGEPVRAAGRRRTREELGFDPGPLEVHGAFEYTARDPESDLAEHEYDIVLLGDAGSSDDHHPDPAEVDGLRLVAPGALRAALADEPGRFTPWLPRVLDVVAAPRSPVPPALLG